MLLRNRSTKNSVRSDGQVYWRIFVAVSLYWIVSISLVFVNKSLLTSANLGLDEAPFFVTWFQCVISAAVLATVGQVRRLHICHDRLQSVPMFSVSLVTSAKIMPLSVVFVSMITFNNLCLKHVDVSFYYIGRSLTTVFNVVCTYLLLGQKTSAKALLCCAIIIGGFWLGVGQESSFGSFSWSGTIFGVLASLCVALNAIFTKKVLPSVDNSVWRLTFINNVNACALFLPLITLNGEWTSFANYAPYHTIHLWTKMTIGGLFGLAIGYLTGLQIEVTSPLTHNVSGTAKAAFQTVLAALIHAEHKGLLWWTSNAIVLGASMGYARIRQLEMAPSPKEYTSTSRESGTVLPDDETDRHPLIPRTV